MSEDFLSRWSRRKREALEEAKDAKEIKASTLPAESECASDAETSAADAKPSSTTSMPAEPPFDITQLPPIESISAATDIRPFLAPGVPADLARAALRRAWSADPTIRNFVGLAEYAWDYHEAGSMPGFGPLEMTEELRQAVARIIGNIPAESQPGVPEFPSDGVTSAEKPHNIKAEQLPPQDRQSNVSRHVPQDVAAQRQDVASNPGRHEITAIEHPAMQQAPAERENVPSIVRRNHGGAIPK